MGVIEWRERCVVGVVEWRGRCVVEWRESCEVCG